MAGLMPPAWEEDASVLPEGAGGCAGTSACWCIADCSVKLSESRQLFPLIFSDEEVIS